MSDSEDDYMSDKLLVGCETEDVRPGLVFNKSDKRKLNIYKTKIEKRQVKKPKSYIEQEKEAREKGLNTALSSDNKGFKLLEKMGYKPGSSLGKTIPGIKEPINVLVKEDSSGMGRESHVKEVIQKIKLAKRNTMKNLEQDFKMNNAQKSYIRFLRKDMFKAQGICEELDFRLGIKEPLETFFWRQETINKIKSKKKEIEDQQENEIQEVEDEESEEDEEEEVYVPNVEHLKTLIDYLRSQHFYCMYCVFTYESKENLASSCPGSYREDHEDDLDEI